MKWREIPKTEWPKPLLQLWGNGSLGENLRYFESGEVRALVAHERGRWHLSISCVHRYPRWRELRDARYDLLPDGIYMAQILPPKDQYVNHHPNTFHLWEIQRPTAENVP